jgi:hypothetical protein
MFSITVAKSEGMLTCRLNAWATGLASSGVRNVQRRAEPLARLHHRGGDVRLEGRLRAHGGESRIFQNMTKRRFCLGARQGHRGHALAKVGQLVGLNRLCCTNRAVQRWSVDAR